MKVYFSNLVHLSKTNILFFCRSCGVFSWDTKITLTLSHLGTLTIQRSSASTFKKHFHVDFLFIYVLFWFSPLVFGLMKVSLCSLNLHSRLLSIGTLLTTTSLTFITMDWKLTCVETTIDHYNLYMGEN